MDFLGCERPTAVDVPGAGQGPVGVGRVSRREIEGVALIHEARNPDVIDVDCKTPHQMRLVNAFCHALDKGEWLRPA